MSKTKQNKNNLQPSNTHTHTQTEELNENLWNKFHINILKYCPSNKI